MKISGAQINQVMRVYKAQRAYKTESVGAQNAPDRKDGVQLSFESSDIEKVKQVVANLPDIRDDLVAPISAKVSSGEYRVDPKEVADKILGRLIADRIR